MDYNSIGYSFGAIMGPLIVLKGYNRTYKARSKKKPATPA